MTFPIATPSANDRAAIVDSERAAELYNIPQCWVRDWIETVGDVLVELKVGERLKVQNTPLSCTKKGVAEAVIFKQLLQATAAWRSFCVTYWDPVNLGCPRQQVEGE